MSDDRKDLPAVSSDNFLQRVREALQTYMGSQGNVLDRGVTLRDLSDTGLIDLSKSYLTTRRGSPVAGPGPAAGGATPVPDLTPPPTPTGFTVGAGISHLFIGCAPQTYSQGHGHLVTRLYGATWTTGDLPVFADATVLTEFQGTVFSHPTNPATTWHLWITWVTRDGVESPTPAGGTNGLMVTSGQDVSSLLDALTGQITQSQLYADLGARIDLIDGNGVGSVNARLAAEAASLQAGIDTVSAELATIAGTEPYDNAAAYSAGELVRYLGKLYRAKVGTTGNLPTNTTYWELVGEYSSLGEAVAAHSVQLSQHETRISTTESGLTAEASARDTLATQIRGGYTGTDPNSLTTGLVYNERVARVTADSANASLISGVRSDLTTTQGTVSGQATAISGLQTSVTSLNGTVSSQGSSITTLNNNVSTLTTGLATKADASAVTALDTRVTAAEGVNTSQASSITSLNSSLTTTNTNVTAAQTAANDAATLAGSKGKVLVQSAAPAVADRLAQNLWIDTTGSANTPKRWNGSTWVAVTDKVATDAAAAAAAAQATANTKADVTALDALTTTVTGQGSTITAQGTRLNSLESTVNNGTTGVAATATALNAVTTRVGTVEGQIVSQASAIETVQSQVEVGTEFTPLRFYGFDAGLDGWTSSVATATASAGLITWSTTGANPSFQRNLATADRYMGSTASTIRAKVRRLSGSAAWEGNAYYSTSLHGASNSFRKAVSAPAVPEVWNVIEWDMSTLTAGEADYVNSEITAIGIDLVSAAGDVWEIDWVSVGSKAATPLSAALSTEASTRATQTGELYAKYTVKVDVAGLISGYGLASTANNAAPTSSFGVRANSFFVAPPAVAQATAPTANLYDGFAWLDTSVTPNVTRYRSGSSWVLNAPVLPFVVQATPTTVNGVAVPAGVYANDLFVKNGTITNAKIANLAVDDAKIANLSVSKLDAGSLKVGSYISSSNYVSGSQGFAIWANGNAEFNNATVRGTVYASSGSFTGAVYASSGSFSGSLYSNDGTIGGIRINNNGLNAGSYYGYAWPTDGGGGFHIGPNGLGFGNANLGRYFQIEANGNIYAPQLSIVNGNASFSGNLQAANGTFSGTLTASAINAVNTINIAGNAVTVPSLTEGMYGASFAPTANWAQSMTSGYSTWPGGTFLTVIVALTCTQTSGGDCEMMCVIVNSAGGEAQIFRSVQTMRSNDKLTVVFMGGVTIPHDDSWRVRIYMRNSWSNGTWVSDKTNILVIGAKR
jgi:hypothetical protein